MNRIILIYGSIAGLIVSAMLVITTIIYHHTGHIDSGALIGYATMLLAFSLIFVGIKKHRDQHFGGSITFIQALKIGIWITCLASTMYVITWLINYFFFMPDFMEKYGALMLEKMKADGVSQMDLDKHSVEMADFIKKYNNPFFNALITYTEILPIGLVVTVLSAAILRKKEA